MNQEQEFFQKEIARELLIEINPTITDQEVDEIWDMCKGNPFNAQLLFHLTKLTKNNT